MKKSSSFANSANPRAYSAQCPYSVVELRKYIRDTRQKIPLNLQQALSLKACSLMLEQAPILQAQHVALYVSQDGELDTQPLIKALWKQGKQTYLPRLHPFNAGHLLFLHYHSETQLVANRYGILEPQLQVSDVIPIEAIDVMVTPLVAFDVQGQRLGMGGGYYDRTLAHWRDIGRPIPMGYAHDCQQVPHIESQPWDIPLPFIVTPTQVIAV